MKSTGRVAEPGLFFPLDHATSRAGDFLLRRIQSQSVQSLCRGAAAPCWARENTPASGMSAGGWRWGAPEDALPGRRHENAVYLSYPCIDTGNLKVRLINQLRMDTRCIPRVWREPRLND